MLNVLFLGAVASATIFRDDSSAEFFAFEKRVAYCEQRFRRADRLDDFARWFPRSGPAFRRAFQWYGMDIGAGVRLLGIPRRMATRPPFMVAVPVHPGEGPGLIINVDLKRSRWVNEFRKRLRHLDGQVTMSPRLNPGSRFGFYAGGHTLDIAFFDRPNTPAAAFDDGLRIATDVAAALTEKVLAIQSVGEL